MLKVAVILDSTRAGRNGEAVARWVYEMAKKRGPHNNNVDFEYIDIKDFTYHYWMNQFNHHRINTARSILKRDLSKLIPLMILSSSLWSTTMEFQAC
jgi:hypothetical protein